MWLRALTPETGAPRGSWLVSQAGLALSLVSGSLVGPGTASRWDPANLAPGEGACVLGHVCSGVTGRGLCAGAVGQACGPWVHCLGTQNLTETTVLGGWSRAGLQDTWVQLCLLVQDGAFPGQSLPPQGSRTDWEKKVPIWAPREKGRVGEALPPPPVALPSLLWTCLHFHCGPPPPSCGCQSGRTLPCVGVKHVLLLLTSGTVFLNE